MLVFIDIVVFTLSRLSRLKLNQSVLLFLWLLKQRLCLPAKVESSSHTEYADADRNTQHCTHRLAHTQTCLLHKAIQADTRTPLIVWKSLIVSHHYFLTPKNKLAATHEHARFGRYATFWEDVQVRGNVSRRYNRSLRGEKTQKIWLECSKSREIS